MNDRARRRWLLVGASAGALFAAGQILYDLRLPVRLTGAAARVNGRSIDAAGVERTVAGMAASWPGARRALSERVVARMIDEELLVQHALEEGAAADDPEVRAALVRAAITRVNAEAAGEALATTDLDVFYAAHAQAYAAPSAYQVTPLYYESADFPRLEGAQTRAAAARARLHTPDAMPAVAAAADPLPFEAPSALIAASTLGNYFGPAALAALATAGAGETTTPVPFGRGLLLLYVNRRVEGSTPPLAGVRDLVRADVLRQRQDAALERLLVSLRGRARIDLAPPPAVLR